MSKHIFTETQKFSQPWIWIVLTIVAGLIFYRIIAEPMESGEILILMLVIGAVVLLIASARLETRIDEEGLYFRYFPFIAKRFYPFHQIKKLEFIQYNSLFKFGGWGIKYNGNMWAYNVAGKHGLLVTLKGKKFLLGTQRSKEMQEFVENFKHLKSGQDVS